MALNPKRLGTDEVEILHLRTHVKALVVPILVLLLDVVVLGAGLALIAGRLPAPYHRWADVALAVACLLVFVAFVLVPWLRWMTTTYTFTNRRIITQSGILHRSGHDLPLQRISDVSYEKSVLDRMLGCGTLVLQTAAEDPVVLDDIPDIEHVHVTMTDLLFSDPQAVAGGYAEQSYPVPPGTPVEQWRQDD